MAHIWALIVKGTGWVEKTLNTVPIAINPDTSNTALRNPNSSKNQQSGITNIIKVIHPQFPIITIVSLDQFG